MYRLDHNHTEILKKSANDFPTEDEIIDFSNDPTVTSKEFSTFEEAIQAMHDDAYKATYHTVDWTNGVLFQCDWLYLWEIDEDGNGASVDAVLPNFAVMTSFTNARPDDRIIRAHDVY